MSHHNFSTKSQYVHTCVYIMSQSGLSEFQYKVHVQVTFKKLFQKVPQELHVTPRLSHKQVALRT